MPEHNDQAPGEVVRDLGDGCVLRWTRASDAEPLGELNSVAHGNQETGEPSEWVRRFTHDLVARPHPTVCEGDALVVEDTRAGKLVSSTCFIPQMWACEGVPFGVGRPEIVTTHPDYRRRGFVRAEFEVLHELSARRGDLMQVVTGIPWYYRQFGYELALDLGGGRSGHPDHVPALKDGESEPFLIRDATLSDIPFIAECHDTACRDALYSAVRDESIWRYELEGRTKENLNHFRVIETPEGTAVGVFVHAGLHGNRLPAWFYQLVPGVSYAKATPSVMRYLKQFGDQAATEKPDARFETLHWDLGVSHPVYDVFPDRLGKECKPYAWYVRVPDVAAFIRHIGTVLERRLEGSPLAGHTGALRIGCFTWGVKLEFDEGTLASVEGWDPFQKERPDVSFPYLSFLHVLMGRRTLDELADVYPDCGGTEEGKALLAVVFPKRPSFVWGVT
jgi:hypothetical protein